MAIAKGIDTKAAVKMKLQGATYKVIAEKMGCSPQNIQQNISNIIKQLNNPAVDHYKQNKIKALNAVEMLCVEHLLKPEAMEKASVNNAAYALAQANTVRRLEEGLATVNVDMHSRIIDVNASIQAIKNLIDNTPDK